MAAAAVARQSSSTSSGANLWPERPAALRPALERYYVELEQLAMTIMRLFAIGLGLPDDWFEDKFDRHITNLCVNYYPPQLEPPGPGQLRRGAHTDYGSLTVLYQDERPVASRCGRWTASGRTCPTCLAPSSSTSVI